MDNDPNRTVLSGSDPLRTQAIPSQSAQATTAMAATKALGIQIHPGRDAAMANGPAREQFLIELSAAGGETSSFGTRTPFNLCLLIDRSGSMEGMPLEYARLACSYVVDLLTPNDILSIVTFEETVEVLMAPQRVTDKAPIKDGISRIVPGNTTNLYDGLSLGCAQILRANEGGRATRLVVLTDGEPTAGIQEFSALVNHAGEIKNKGITLTFLGFGPDYNEELLAAMAKRTGGNYAYIARPELIPEVFRSELEKLMSVIARNLSLEVKLSRWVGLRSSQADSPGDRDFTFPLSDMERGTTLQRVLDFEFTNHPLGWYRVAVGRLHYEDLLTGRRESVQLDFTIEFTADSMRYSAPQNPRVAQAVQIEQASRVVEKTILGLKTQQLSAAGAMAELQKTQALLLSQGRTQEAQEVTLALRAIQSGDTGGAEKTLIGTMVNLDQGKTQ